MDLACLAESENVEDPLTLWRRQHEQRLADKAATSLRNLEAARQEAALCTSTMLGEHLRALELRRTNNRTLQKEIMLENSRVDDATWTQACDLCDFTFKDSHGGKDRSRLREVLLTLKSHPPVRMRAGTVADVLLQQRARASAERRGITQSQTTRRQKDETFTDENRVLNKKRESTDSKRQPKPVGPMCEFGQAATTSNESGAGQSESEALADFSTGKTPTSSNEQWPISTIDRTDELNAVAPEHLAESSALSDSLLEVQDVAHSIPEETSFADPPSSTDDGAATDVLSGGTLVMDGVGSAPVAPTHTDEHTPEPHCLEHPEAHITEERLEQHSPEKEPYELQPSEHSELSPPSADHSPQHSQHHSPQHVPEASPSQAGVLAISGDDWCFGSAGTQSPNGTPSKVAAPGSPPSNDFDFVEHHEHSSEQEVREQQASASPGDHSEDAVEQISGTAEQEAHAESPIEELGAGGECGESAVAEHGDNGTDGADDGTDHAGSEFGGSVIHIDHGSDHGGSEFGGDGIVVTADDAKSATSRADDTLSVASSDAVLLDHH